MESQKLFYYDNREEYEKDREKAISLLREAGFNEEVLQEEIRYSQRDNGDEFFWRIGCLESGKELIEEWKKKHDLSQKEDARSFVFRCTWDGD